MVGNSVTWRRYEEPLGQVNHENLNTVNEWEEGKHIQDVVAFLREEAAMAGEQLIFEVSKSDVPGWCFFIYGEKSV